MAERRSADNRDRGTTPTSLPRWLVSEVLQYAPSSLVPAAAGFLLVPALTHILPPYRYGQYSLIATAVSIMDALLIGWLSNSVLRFYVVAEQRDELPGLFRKVLLYWFTSSLAGVALLVIVSRVIPEVLPLDSWELILTVAVLGSIVMGTDIAQRTLRAQLRPAAYSASASSQALLKLAGSVAGCLLLESDRLLGLMLGWTAGSLLVLMGTVALAVPRVAPRARGWGGGRPTLQLRELLAFGGPVSVNLLLSLILSDADRFLLQVLRGSEEVGLYSAAYVISAGALATVYPLSVWSIYPRLTRLWEDADRRQDGPRVLTQGLRLFLILAVPATVGIAVLSQRIIHLLAPQGYASVAIVMTPIVVGVFWLGIAQFTTLGLLLSRKTVRYSIILVAAGAVNVSMNLWLIRWLGLVGAGLATAVTYVFYAAAGAAVCRRELEVNVPWVSLGRVLLASVLMAIVVAGLSALLPSAFWVLFLLAGLGVVVYGGVLTVLGELRLSR